MSWARKLFVETSSAPVLTSATTSFPTNYTTTWNTNTSDSTNVATSRITTTVWYAGTTTTSWNTNRTTTGTISSNTSTEWSTSGSYTTSWFDSRNTETGQTINTNTTTSYYSYWNTNSSFYTQILTDKNTLKTTTTPTNTSSTTGANITVFYTTNTNTTYSVSVPIYHETFVNTNRTTNWQTAISTTCSPTSVSYSNVTVTNYEGGNVYWDRDPTGGTGTYNPAAYGAVYQGDDGSNCPPYSCAFQYVEVDENGLWAAYFICETHCVTSYSSTYQTCVTNFGGASASTDYQSFYDIIIGYTSENTTTSTNTVTWRLSYGTKTTNWNTNTTYQVNDTTSWYTQGPLTSSLTQKETEIYTNTLTSTAQERTTTWGSSRVTSGTFNTDRNTSTSYTGSTSTNWNTSRTTDGGAGSGSQNTTTTFDTSTTTSWTTQESQNTSVTTDRTTSWMTN